MRQTRLFAPIALLAFLTTGLAAAPADAPVLHFDEVIKANPIDATRGAVLTEVVRGEQASVNFWQMTKGLPLHFHRSHEEVIFVKSGRAEVRIGERTVTMQAGDLVLIPKDTLHSARAVGEGPFRGISVFAPAFDGKDRIMVDQN